MGDQILDSSLLEGTLSRRSRLQSSQFTVGSRGGLWPVLLMSIRKAWGH
jgi:hypothetical protein